MKACDRNEQIPKFCCLFTNASFKHHHKSVTALHRCHGYGWKAIKPNNHEYPYKQSIEEK